jgi:ABC-type multidrug transport system fused ATPase/permease subunit
VICRWHCSRSTRNSATALANNIVYETHRVATGTLQNMLLLVTSAFSGVLIVVSVVAVNWRFALSAGLSLGAIYTALYLLARRRLVRNGAREVELFDARARTLSEGFGAIRELLLVRNQHLFRDALARQSREIARVASGTLAITHSPRYVLEFFAAASLAAAAVIMSGAGSAQWITQLSFLGLAAYRLLPALQQAFAAMAHLRADHGAFLRVAEDLQSARAAPPRRVPPADPHWQGRPQRELVLNEIQFAYDVDSRFAIRNASLKIGAGSIVGLVGANGSGKTTLAEIMLGLLTPHSGTITVDGLPVDENSRVSWQSNVAYVPQQVFVLDASLADNIVFGATSLDEARVREVAERVGVAHLLDQPLGERGVRLSGGQRQRIGIARALYRNATFLVLDEATSALDAPAESELVETLHSLRGRQTVVLLAHRVSSLSQCDQIVELDAGTVVPRGDYRDYLGYLERSRKFGAAGS